MYLDRCCGTCRFWIIEPDKTFAKKLKERFQSTDPHCRLNKKTRCKEEGKGCLGYKEADPWDIEARGYTYEG